MQIETRSDIRRTKTDRGIRFCQSLTIANTQPDAKDATVHFWLEVTEPSFFSLLEWHSFTPTSPIALAPGAAKPVTLSFDIPAHAAPGIYHYTIAYKSEQHINKTIRHPLQLEVPSIQSSPKPLTVTVDPVTTAETPYSVRPGRSITFTLKIKNCSSFSDLIYLNCSGLPPETFTIDYLNQEEQSKDATQPVDGLRLEAHGSGEIRFTVHPSKTTLAGNYSPTLQLISIQTPDLLTLDLLHIQVLAETHLETELTPKTRSIPQEDASFVLTVRNRGNIERKFRLDAKDSEKRFQFAIEKRTITVPPNQEMSIVLSATPRRKWHRPLWGKPLRSSVSFYLIPTDLTSATPPYPPQAKLLWFPRPKWVLAAALLLGASTVLVLLSLLYRFNRQPMTTADILSFSPTKRTYLEGASNAVRLNWAVRNPETLDRLVLVQLDEGAEIQSKAYDFSTSIPQELQAKSDRENGCRRVRPVLPVQSAPVLWELPLPDLPWFSSIQQPTNYTKIECQGIPLVSSQSGAFKYRLKLFSKSDTRVPIVQQTTETVTVKSTGSSQPAEESPLLMERSSKSDRPPQILSFTLNGRDATGQLTHTFPVANGEVANIEVAWQVAEEDDLEVELLPFSGTVKPQGSITYPIMPGNVKTITLTARNRNRQQITQSVDIQVVVADVPRSPRRTVPRSSPQPSPASPTPTPEVSPSVEASPIPQPSPSATPTPTPTPEASPSPSP